ncbi:GNAT family N-acetyltransferase [Nocardia bovistercoris]|uniref:GNAT family N-acetyltransferase n=1 Tax=Nocardia bovistercoris TaxID=2785916 RepID=A0A931ICY0_9NOCA|nr:GNAT family N-acetyltransferase [Nocardia bovistercoris]MBH0779367.1 GNAT family N-acetyltransferase [Nocardia bovistercoris]
MTSSATTVRVATAVDSAAVTAMAVEFYSAEGFATDARELGNNLVTLLASPAARVAVVDGGAELLGFAVTTTGFGLENGPIAVLDDLFVVPSARRLGLGGLLIEDCTAWARERGCPYLELVVAPNGRDVGHLFTYYRARGFLDEGRRLLSKRL